MTKQIAYRQFEDFCIDNGLDFATLAQKGGKVEQGYFNITPQLNLKEKLVKMDDFGRLEKVMGVVAISNELVSSAKSLGKHLSDYYPKAEAIVTDGGSEHFAIVREPTGNYGILTVDKAL